MGLPLTSVCTLQRTLPDSAAHALKKSDRIIPFVARHVQQSISVSFNPERCGIRVWGGSSRSRVRTEHEFHVKINVFPEWRNPDVPVPLSAMFTVGNVDWKGKSEARVERFSSSLRLVTSSILCGNASQCKALCAGVARNIQVLSERDVCFFTKVKTQGQMMSRYWHFEQNYVTLQSYWIKQAVFKY